MNKGNPLIFIRVEDPSLEFLPMQVISSYTGFRYLWNENLKKATLADSSSYYEFTAFDTRVVRNRQEDKTEDMTTAAAFQSTIHIGEDYTLVHFGCEAVYLTGTKYGVLSDGDINDKAEELVQAFLEKGEE
jgi:hypothetical protein